MLQGRVVSVKRAASTLEGQENTDEGQKGLNATPPSPAIFFLALLELCPRSHLGFGAWSNL